MPADFHFVEAPDEPSEVLGWFRSLAEPPEETVTARGIVLYFRHVGPLDIGLDQLGQAAVSRSPVVSLVLPQVRRGLLWTTGAASFLTMPVSRFPEMARLRRDFARWIGRFPLVYDPRRDADNEYAYYLEGGARNKGVLYGLPSGMTALAAGRYFVDALDTQARLDVVCKTLRLRGVECLPA